jgi:hypothetical protein
MTDGLLEEYWELIKDSTNPAPELVKFYTQVTDAPYSTLLIPQLNKLCKIYGKYNVLLSIAQLSEFETLDTSNIIRLITYLAKQRFENKYGSGELERVVLDNYTRDIGKDINKIRGRRLKITPKDPFQPIGDLRDRHLELIEDGSFYGDVIYPEYAATVHDLEDYPCE